MKATQSVMRGAVAVTLLGATVWAADPAYIGKWKFNAAKSALTGDTVTIESAAGEVFL